MIETIHWICFRSYKRQADSSKVGVGDDPGIAIFPEPAAFTGTYIDLVAQLSVAERFALLTQTEIPHTDRIFKCLLGCWQIPA